MLILSTLCFFITSNLLLVIVSGLPASMVNSRQSDKSNVSIRVSDEIIKTDLKKMGAILGDYVEIGCNSVLNPGTVIGKNTTVYPLSSVRGYINESSIYKNENNIIRKGE